MVTYEGLFAYTMAVVAVATLVVVILQYIHKNNKK